MSLGLPLTLLALMLNQFEQPDAHGPSAADAPVIQQKLEQLNEHLRKLKTDDIGRKHVVDVAIYAKAADWIMRHNEFYESKYSEWTVEVLDKGLQRAAEMTEARTPWFPREGTTILGYKSSIDDSIQPYAVTLPKGYSNTERRLWPLHVVLHGRNAKLNEVSFIHEHDGKAVPDDRNWIQLDIFGRTNNAYRWSGETDVFEALSDLRWRANIDWLKVALRGFSMGGAGTWHIGLHYPSHWAAIGAGAGFVDTVHHLKLEKPLSPLHQKLTRIYDAQDYALNAFNVPIIGYGGELDPQLFAAKAMHAKGQEVGVPIEILIGPETAHKFHPDSLRKFMAFINTHTEKGRPDSARAKRLKFVTYTVKYKACEWISIEEQVKPYEASTVEVETDDATNTVEVQTTNVAMLRIEGVAGFARIDGGKPLPLERNTHKRANYFEKTPDGWQPTNDDRIREFAQIERRDVTQVDSHRIVQFSADRLRKRHNLQGPIDDAFMQPFVCVRPTGQAWSEEHANWAKWTLERFEKEFDKRLRGRIPVVNDNQVTDQLISDKNLILFGDPGSNILVAQVIDQLPVKWTRDRFEVQGQSYSTAEHGLALIYPNPLNPRKYVVLNSGHTFHETEFMNSNANLYPRLGDFGIIKFAAQSAKGIDEQVVFSDLFDARWQLSSR